MFNFFEELFAPGRKHAAEEQKRLELTRVDLGVGDPGRGPIDLASGKVVVRAPGTGDGPVPGQAPGAAPDRVAAPGADRAAAPEPDAVDDGLGEIRGVPEDIPEEPAGPEAGDASPSGPEAGPDPFAEAGPDARP
ncbi:DUF6191 domain-containing protein [Streptomyces sp. NPDC052052]|uniref:DUF6191 domain-containing protein n=1 Tax=Streptomyces sp. NPDC052052 TaxID=3154756 RepID=UPI0034357622